MNDQSTEKAQRPNIWNALTDDERQGIYKMTEHLDDPDFYTAEELRDLADHDWTDMAPGAPMHPSAPRFFCPRCGHFSHAPAQGACDVVTSPEVPSASPSASEEPS